MNNYEWFHIVYGWNKTFFKIISTISLWIKNIASLYFLTIIFNKLLLDFEFLAILAPYTKIGNDFRNFWDNIVPIG